MAIEDLKGQMARLPEQPGVYLFLGSGGETLYVGKARVLRDRVRSYLAARGNSPRIDALLRDATSLEVIVTDSVVEALALENRLIKQRNPRFNILLRDDKTYPYLQLTTTEPAPRMLVARRVERDGNVYAGPFMPASMARRTMSLAHRLFGIRSCNEVIDGQRGRPCLEYDIKRCLAPCVASICSLEEYGHAVEQARLLMEGRQNELIDTLRDEMLDAASHERFERAAHLRDAIRTVETLRDRRNSIETPAMGDRDAFGVKVGPAGAVVHVFQVRRGRVVDRIELLADEREAPGSAVREIVVSPDADVRGVVATALQQFYADRPAPGEVHLPVDLDADDRDAIEQWLSNAVGRRVRLVVPQRGDKRGLLDLAIRNASVAYQSHFADGETSAFEALDTLRVVLGLPALPKRIECFDISTLQGRETVASMVVAVDGRMRRSDYRKFRIRGTFMAAAGADAPLLDDFAAMREVILRRYQRLTDQGGPFPDLIVIDGGKGQLAAAYESLAELGLDRLVAIGLAKQEELIFTRDRIEGIALPHEGTALRLLQRIRDEAHRFAVTFHRQSRQKRDLRSDVDDITGVGPRRRRQLLTAFGSVAGIRRASREDLESVVGAKVAEAVIRHFGEH
ncbi:MAG: excinuclease ABC subunit UvrC [Acidobacteria bacterium]|nr:excinuclease ABC subunit UvrC [Acidobacteriota bacterium]